MSWSRCRGRGCHSDCPRWGRYRRRRRTARASTWWGIVFLQAEDGIRGGRVTGVQTCALPIFRRLIDRQANAVERAARSGTLVEMSGAIMALDREGFDSALQGAVLAMEADERAAIRERTAFDARMNGTSRSALMALVLTGIFLGIVGSRRVLIDLDKRAAVERALSLKEEQYRQVVETAGDMICRTDEQGRFSFCNQTALATLHLAEDELIGRSWLKLVRQDRRRHAERFYLRQFGRRQKSTYYEFPIVDGHGIERWVGQNVQLVFESDRIV